MNLKVLGHGPGAGDAPRLMLAELSEGGVEDLTLESMLTLLGNDGFGWTTKLQQRADQGLVGEAKKFYLQNFPSLRDLESQSDTDEE